MAPSQSKARSALGDFDRKNSLFFFEKFKTEVQLTDHIVLVLGTQQGDLASLILSGNYYNATVFPAGGEDYRETALPSTVVPALFPGIIFLPVVAAV